MGSVAAGWDGGGWEGSLDAGGSCEGGELGTERRVVVRDRGGQLFPEPVKVRRRVLPG